LGNKLKNPSLKNTLPAAFGDGEEAQRRGRLDFYKNPIFLSPKTPLSTKEYRY
jgi:hypothetical protein